MNAALFTKSTTGLILASGLIAASSVLGHAQDASMALGTLATYPLSQVYATVPAGQATLGGHTFDMTSGNMLKLATNASTSFAGSYQNAKAVHLLLNSANTSSWLAGTPVGTVLLTFSDSTTQTATLTVGGNLREWYTGAFGVVNSVSDVTPSATTPYSTQVWTTTVLGGTGTAVLDMLSVPVTTANKTLTSVQLTNNNPYGGSLTLDLSGLTVEFTPPAPPTPAPVPAPGTTGSGHETGNHNGDHQNTDKTATTDKKSVKTETNAQNGKQDDGGNRKQDDGGNRGNHHRNISD